MIKNYLTYIKEQTRHDLDPYGEDDWDEITPIIEIAQLQGKPYDRIKYLNCSRKDLKSLEGIEKLVNLEYLFCYDNQLTSLKGIENLVNLDILYCHNNQLTSIEGIENLGLLRTLVCHTNRFTKEYKEYLENYCDKKDIGSII